MRKETIRTLMIEPMKHPKVFYIKPTLKTFQKIVDADAVIYGGIEAKKLESNIYTIFNKDRYLADLMPNRQVNGDIISGNMLIVATNDCYEPISMTDEQLIKYALRFWHTEHFDDMDVMEANLTLMFSRFCKDEEL